MQLQQKHTFSHMHAICNKDALSLTPMHLQQRYTFSHTHAVILTPDAENDRVLSDIDGLIGFLLECH